MKTPTEKRLNEVNENNLTGPFVLLLVPPSPSAMNTESKAR